MKELPATLVMRPFNFTPAVQAYTLAMDERLTEASTASLATVAVGLIPVIRHRVPHPASDRRRQQQIRRSSYPAED
jgi:ABC-type Fe3+ transport system permease subunit